MENQHPNYASLTYCKGWHVALHNFDVFEVESINQLVNTSKDSLLPQLSGLNAQGKHYFTTNLAE